MPRPLTAIAVANMKSDAGKRREVTDGACPGLRLVVQPTGAKSWAFRYERLGGRAAKLTLGSAAGPGALSLSAARQIVDAARRELASGRDPIEARKAEKAAAIAAAAREDDRVDAVLDRFFKRHVDKLKSAKSVREYFDREVRPVWGKRRIDEITRKDVIKLVEDIAERGANTTANRVLANVRAWLNWCVDRGLIETSPAERVKPPNQENVRDRTLNDVELSAMVRGIDRLHWPWRQFFSICLLTGQRRAEVAGMRWDELHLDAANPVWILPPARTKNGREHAVPLVPQIVEMLRGMPRHGASALVFTTTGVTPISGFSRAKSTLGEAMGAAAADSPSWRLHDLRRTVASGMARLGIAIAVVEKVLNHVSGTFAGIVGVYQRHDFASEKREALTAWADHVDRLKDGVRAA